MGRGARHRVLVLFTTATPELPSLLYAGSSGVMLHQVVIVCVS